METIQEPVKPRSSSFNINAPSFVPPSRSRTPSFNNSTFKLDKSKYGKDNKLKRPRSKSMQVSMVPKEKHVYRAKVGNISMKSSKTDLADFFKQHFSDVKSTDFQPRYSEHGMMFGFVVFETEKSLLDCIQLSGSVVNGDTLKIERADDKTGVPTSTTIIITNVPEHTTLEEAKTYVSTHKIQPLFFSFYVPHETTLSSSLYLQYLNMEEAGKAYGELVNTQWKDVTIKMAYKKRDDRKEYGPLSTTVYLNPTAKDIWIQLYDYKSNYYKNLHNNTPPVLIFPYDLSSFMKACVYTFSEKLSLCHAVQGIGENKHVIVSSAPPKLSEEPFVSRHSSLVMDSLSPVPDEEDDSTSPSSHPVDKDSSIPPPHKSSIHSFPMPRKRSRAQSMPTFSTSSVNYSVSRGPKGQETGFHRERTAKCPL